MLKESRTTALQGEVGPLFMSLMLGAQTQSTLMDWHTQTQQALLPTSCLSKAFLKQLCLMYQCDQRLSLDTIKATVCKTCQPVNKLLLLLHLPLLFWYDLGRNHVHGSCSYLIPLTISHVHQLPSSVSYVWCHWQASKWNKTLILCIFLSCNIVWNIWDNISTQIKHKGLAKFLLSGEICT